MEQRKPLQEIKMESSPLFLLWHSIVGEFKSEATRGQAFFSSLLCTVFGALLSSTHTVFGVFPLGFAYLCVCRKKIVFVLLGCILGTVGMGQAGLVYTFVYILVFLTRAYVSAPLQKRRIFPICETYFFELVQLRIALLLLCGALLSLYELVLFGLSFTSLYFALGMMSLPLLSALLFLGVTESEISITGVFGMINGKKTQNDITESLDFGRVHPVYAQLCMLFICVCLSFSLRRFTVFGLNLNYAFVALCTLFTSKRFGALRASIAGSVCALTLSAVYAPSFCALGLLSGLLWQFGSFYAFTLGCAAAVGWAGYIGGVGGFVEIAPEVCVVSLLCMPFFSALRSDVYQKRKAQLVLGVKEQTRALAYPTQKSDRTAYLASALAGVSNIFFATPDVKKPSASEYFEMCEGVCEKKCASCEKKASCWDTPDRIAYRTVCKISDSLYRDGVIKKDTVPSEMTSVCAEFASMTEEMRTGAAELGLAKIRGDKTRFISLDYAMTSKLLEKTARAEKRDFSEDESTQNALLAAAREISDEDICVSVFGGRKKSIAIGALKGDTLRAKSGELHAAFESVCGCKLSEFEFLRTSDGVSAKTHTEKMYDVEFATSSAPSGNGEMCADRAKCFSCRDGLFYSVISDGMGTGDVAAASACVCISFLEKMLRAGAGKSLSLRMLNNIIRSKDKECSTTLDLLEMDLIYGKATFLKCGASPSYIKRGEDITVIKSCSSPIGILRSTDAQKTDISICDGDIIVLVSDGVTGTDDGEWLVSALSSDLPDDLHAAANELVVMAARQNLCRDDTTVSLIRVKKA